MTSSEEFLKVYDYFNRLEPFVWHDFKKVPEDIAQKVFEAIESGTYLNEYHLGWCNTLNDLFMKTKIPKI